MRLATAVPCFLAAAALFLSRPASADAQDYFNVVQTTYEVQVEYWFFDTDYYYWRTVFESSDLEEAQFVYQLLLLAKQNHQLNQAAPNEYWRYIAVDVRLVPKYHYPRYQLSSSSLKLTGAALGSRSIAK